MPDWTKIKTEYITGTESYRTLGKKYGIHYQKICEKGCKEKWPEERKQYRNDLVAKSIEKIKDESTERMKTLLAASDKVMGIAMEMLNSDGLAPKDLRAIAAVLMDVKELQMIRSDADRREQEARIAALNAKVTAVDDDGESGVVLLPEVVEDG